jgi:hypothetical protein
MSFTDKLNEAIRQVLHEYDLKQLKLEDEITIPDLTTPVGIKLEVESDDLPRRSVHLLINLPAIIETGEDITVETFKRHIVSQLGRIGIIPTHVLVNQFAHPFLSEDGKTVIVGTRDVSGEVTILEIPIAGVEFIVGELQKLLKGESESMN